MDTVSRATRVPLQDGVEGLTVQPSPPPGGSHDLDRAERPVAEGQGLRRRVGRPRRPRRRLPPRLALQVGGPRLHAHHAARARRRGPVPDQPVRRLLRRDHGLQPGEDRPQGPEDRPLALRGESGRLRDPQRHPRRAARREVRAAHPHAQWRRRLRPARRPAADLPALDVQPREPRLSRLRGARPQRRREAATRGRPRRQDLAHLEEPRAADGRRDGGRRVGGHVLPRGLVRDPGTRAGGRRADPGTQAGPRPGRLAHAPGPARVAGTPAPARATRPLVQQLTPIRDAEEDVMKDELRFVDCDMHIMEPPDLFERYLDPAFKHRVILPIGADGRPVRGTIVVDGLPTTMDAELQQYRKKSKAAVDTSQSTQPLSGSRITGRLDFAIQRKYDPEAQLMGMEMEGVDIAVLYPTTGLSLLARGNMDPKLSLALCQAYNNWIHEFCRHRPEKLRFVAMLPPHDVHLACRELLRCVRELGAVGSFMRPNLVNGHFWHSNYWDPLYTLHEDLNVTWGFHEEIGRAHV